MGSNVCVVAGSSQTGKTYLLSQILGSGAELTSSSHPDFRHCTWQADTKYYSAQIDLPVTTQSPQPNSSHSDDRAGLSPECDVLEACQALVLVCDLHNRSSLSFVKQWAQWIDDQCPAVAIAIANHTSDSTDSNVVSNLAKLQEWCSKHQVECIEVEHGAKLDATERDTQGIGRVVEALHCHMWPDMTMKDRRQNSTDVPQQSNSVNGADEVDATTLKEPSMADLHQSENGGLLGTGLDDDGDDDLDLGDFTALLGEIKAVRSSAVGLSDEQRRARAAETATKMMKLLGLDGSDVAHVEEDSGSSVCPTSMNGEHCYKSRANVSACVQCGVRQ